MVGRGRDALSVELPNGGKLNLTVWPGATAMHLVMSPSVENDLTGRFDLVKTRSGDYVVDSETACRLILAISRNQEHGEKIALREAVLRLGEELGRMTATEQRSEAVFRKGQSKLRAYLLAKFGACQISGLRRKGLLVASHIKPWKMCCDGPDERLDPENVLLLSANWDALFDHFYISFDPENGAMLCSDRITDAELAIMGVPVDWRTSVRIPVTSDRRRSYLAYHNKIVLAKR